ncbi:unnamed protein product [Gadus morhua 'NCC']
MKSNGQSSICSAAGRPGSCALVPTLPSPPRLCAGTCPGLSSAGPSDPGPARCRQSALHHQPTASRSYADPSAPCETVPRLSGSSSISSLRREPPTLKRVSMPSTLYLHPPPCPRWSPRCLVNESTGPGVGCDPTPQPCATSAEGRRRHAIHHDQSHRAPCEGLWSFRAPCRRDKAYIRATSGLGEPAAAAPLKDVVLCALPHHNTSQGINIITRAALNNKNTAFPPLSPPLPFQFAVI